MNNMVLASLLFGITAAEAADIKYVHGQPVRVDEVRTMAPRTQLRSRQSPSKQACVASVPDTQERYSWRTIDGRTCWYKGTPGKPKEELYWAAATNPPKVHTAPTKRRPGAPETVPLPPTPPNPPTTTPNQLTEQQLTELTDEVNKLEDLTTRLNYYFSALMQNPIPPGMQVPLPPNGKTQPPIPSPPQTIPPKPARPHWWPEWWHNLWQRWFGGEKK